MLSAAYNDRGIFWMFNCDVKKYANDSAYLTINGADSPEKDKKAGQFPET